jgi:hypothetical protein
MYNIVYSTLITSLISEAVHVKSVLYVGKYFSLILVTFVIFIYVFVL